MGGLIGPPPPPSLKSRMVHNVGQPFSMEPFIELKLIFDRFFQKEKDLNSCLCRGIVSWACSVSSIEKNQRIWRPHLCTPRRQEGPLGPRAPPGPGSCLTWDDGGGGWKPIACKCVWDPFWPLNDVSQRTMVVSHAPQQAASKRNEHGWAQQFASFF